MTVLDKSGQTKMKIRIRKHQYSFCKRKSLSTYFLDLLGRVKHKGSEKCNRNDQRYGTVSIQRSYNPLSMEKTPGSKNMIDSYKTILSNTTIRRH